MIFYPLYLMRYSVELCSIFLFKLCILNSIIIDHGTSFPKDCQLLKGRKNLCRVRFPPVNMYSIRFAPVLFQLKNYMVFCARIFCARNLKGPKIVSDFRLLRINLYPRSLHERCQYRILRSACTQRNQIRMK